MLNRIKLVLALTAIMAASHASAYVITGSKWESGPNNSASFGPFGTPGSAAWSIMGAGLTDASGFDSHGGGVTSAITSLGVAGFALSDYVSMITSVFSVWSSVSGFTSLRIEALSCAFFN